MFKLLSINLKMMISIAINSKYRIQILNIDQWVSLNKLQWFLCCYSGNQIYLRKKDPKWEK